ncbi:hypothetical protein CAL26_09835 [Bordetella genomosp. 9]|uniref:VRR-NUC domain-containing protein n=1 Tax=Bordetella genomosp. 9 TaxID=1416803 RepID=A0A261RGC2_9BORD|nr:VRR-NUC domain-containing protein [Bordetella genomosp. 9]OZI23722.1 hypothetical protein CAL26_09835 [Bordetella genomosp. 9]
MRESLIEAHGLRLLTAAGQLFLKFTSPARRSVPDRIRLAPIPPEHRELVARYVSFVELKATGKKPTAAQEREHARLRALGYDVRVIDSKAGVNDYVNEVTT